jgi:hypothetical protein
MTYFRSFDKFMHAYLLTAVTITKITDTVAVSLASQQRRVVSSRCGHCCSASLVNTGRDRVHHDLHLSKPREPTVTVTGRTTPVLMLHGKADGVVRFSFISKATKRAREKHWVFVEKVELKPYADLEHSANRQEIGDLAAFLQRVIHK